MSKVPGLVKNSTEGNINVEVSRNRESLAHRNDETFLSEKIVTSLKDQSSKMICESDASELECLEEEMSLLKAAVKLAIDDQNSVDFHPKPLKQKVDAKKHHLQELNSQW